MATLDSFLGLGKRSRTSVDIAKRNKEDGTALSQSKKREDEESEHQKIPGYIELKILLAASHNFQPDPNYEAASLFLTCQHLIQEVASLAEDNEEPIHRAFSLWNPTLADIGGKQGLVVFRVLWLKLLQVDESSVPGYLLNVRKASICAIASKIHTALAAKGLVDDAEVEIDYDPSKDESSALWEDEEDPLGMDIDGPESPRHFKSTGPLFKLLRKKCEDKVPISENEEKKASNEIPITDGDVKNSGQQLDILDQLQGMAARFGDQAFDQLKFDELLVNFFVATDQPFQLTENPHFRDLLHYHQYTYPTMKPEHKTMPAKGTSWNSDDEGGASDQDINHVDTGAKSMKVPMRKKLWEKVMKKGEVMMQELKQELKKKKKGKINYQECVMEKLGTVYDDEARAEDEYFEDEVNTFKGAIPKLHAFIKGIQSFLNQRNNWLLELEKALTELETIEEHKTNLIKLFKAKYFPKYGRTVPVQPAHTSSGSGYTGSYLADAFNDEDNCGNRDDLEATS
ncbi:hypothetical protein BT69DRAFT_1332754 [Atractiella rhizophila]|nr:hypothetical protein BT69DRAFT_1332754 [Atractiella rhizophila]